MQPREEALNYPQEVLDQGIEFWDRVKISVSLAFWVPLATVSMGRVSDAKRHSCHQVQDLSQLDPAHAEEREKTLASLRPGTELEESEAATDEK